MIAVSERIDASFELTSDRKGATVVARGGSQDEAKVTDPGLHIVQGSMFPPGRPGLVIGKALGGDQDLVARRSVQLFTSLFHPLLFTPFPRVFFGCDLSSTEGREAYVRRVVADAPRPPGR